MNSNTHYLGDSVYLEFLGGKSFVLFTNNGELINNNPVKFNAIFIEPEVLRSLLLVLKSNSLIP